MQCPYCQREMKQGVVQSGQDVWFAEKRRSLFFYQGFRKGDVPITRNFWNSSTSSAPASYCETCKKVIIQLEGDKL